MLLWMHYQPGHSRANRFDKLIHFCRYVIASSYLSKELSLEDNPSEELSPEHLFSKELSPEDILPEELSSRPL